MSLNLPILTRRALDSVLARGRPLVQDGLFVRPQTNASSEVRASCKAIGAHVVSSSFLGLAPVTPGTENLLIRASELVAITAPGSGDYIVENATGQRRNVHAARLDPSG